MLPEEVKIWILALLSALIGFPIIFWLFWVSIHSEPGCFGTMCL